MIWYRKATLEDLHTLWDRHIRENPEDPRYLRWKREFIDKNVSGAGATFVILDGDVPVGEVTLDYRTSGNREKLADGVTSAYLCALRIRKEYEGKGYISQLMRTVEAYAFEKGLHRLTIGVEAAETRNLSIYLHWGYDKLVMWEEEDCELILFYGKELK